MPRYLQFSASDGSAVLVEVDTEEVAPPAGVVKAGLKERAQQAVAQAGATFEDALQHAVRRNAEALLKTVRGLSEAPESFEATFGLKATGEVGNFALSKASGEATFTIKLTWKNGASGQPSSS